MIDLRNEWQTLKPLWAQRKSRYFAFVGDHHPISVGEVAEHFANTTGQARTTVLTTMERLRRKGHLSRKRRQGRLSIFPQSSQTRFYG